MVADYKADLLRGSYQKTKGKGLLLTPLQRAFTVKGRVSEQNGRIHAVAPGLSGSRSIAESTPRLTNFSQTPGLLLSPTEHPQMLAWLHTSLEEDASQ